MQGWDKDVWRQAHNRPSKGGLRKMPGNWHVPTYGDEQKASLASIEDHNTQ